MAQIQNPKEQNPPAIQKTIPSLSTKNLINHFLLLHDFFFRMTKVTSKNAQFFDLQIEILNGMKNAVSTGQKVAQAATFGGLCWYFMKGNSIKLRFVYGFFFMYWLNHITTAGAYMGALFRIPNLYNKTGAFYMKRRQQNTYFDQLNNLMNQDYQEEDIMNNLSSLFDGETKQKDYVNDEFYIKNRQKYISKEILDGHHLSKKLTYLDCFVSRYVYYSFTRWCKRVGTFFSLEFQD